MSDFLEMDYEITKQFPLYIRNFVDLSRSGENKNGEAFCLSALELSLYFSEEN